MPAFHAFLDVDNILAGIKKEIPQYRGLKKDSSRPQESKESRPSPLNMMQRTLKRHYFGDDEISAGDFLKELDRPGFNEFPRLKYVLHCIFSGNPNIEIPDDLKDWNPSISFQSLNQKYGYFKMDLSDLYRRLAIVCRKMTSIIEGQAYDDEMAYKLMALFYEQTKRPEEQFEKILQKFNAIFNKSDRAIAHPYHDTFVTMLTPFPAYEDVTDFSGWKQFIAKEGVKSLNIFSQCAHENPLTI